MKQLFILLLSLCLCLPAFSKTKQAGKRPVAQKTHTTATKHHAASKKHHAKRKIASETPLIKHNTASAKGDTAGSTNLVVDNLLTILERELGKPYRLGSNGPTGFDCSGLIKFAFSFIGIALPRTASDIGQVGQMITMDDLHPGDLLFFSGRRQSRSNIGHVGCVYKVDSGKVYMIHSSQEGVNILDINKDEYYKKRFICAKRIFGPDSCSVVPAVKSKG